MLSHVQGHSIPKIVAIGKGFGGLLLFMAMQPAGMRIPKQRFKEKRIQAAAARILREVHARHILHHDLRADQFLEDIDGCVKLIDFGEAEICEDNSMLEQELSSIKDLHF